MISMSLPAATADQLKTDLQIVEDLRQNPYKYMPGLKIDAIYGCPTPAKWHGGRTLEYQDINAKQFIQLVRKFNDLGVKCRIQFTNCFIEEKHLNDKWCNFILDTLDNGFENDVVIWDGILYDYIQKTHPNIPLIASLTNVFTFEEFERAFDKNYKWVVVYPLRENCKRLVALPQELKDRTEIIVNDECGLCKFRKFHYGIEAKRNLNIPLSESESTFMCQGQDKRSLISPEEMVSTYIKEGFCNFKLSGRQLLVDIESYVKNISPYLKFGSERV